MKSCEETQILRLGTEITGRLVSSGVCAEALSAQNRMAAWLLQL